MTTTADGRFPDLARERVTSLDLKDPAVLRRLFAASVPNEDPDLVMRRSVTRWLMADRTLTSLRRDCEEAGCDWRVIKGVAVGTHDYPIRELRPIGDLDILVAASDVQRARQQMESSGWRALGSASGSLDDYLRHLGYCWQAIREGHLLCEVHFRLWGSLPASAARDALAWATEATEGSHLDTGVPTLPASMRYVLASAHAWMVSAPRPQRCWWDLEWIALDAPSRAQVAEISRAWGMQLPLVLATEMAMRRFGSDTTRREFARRLCTDLRWSERWLLRRCRRRGEAAVSQRSMNVARLLAGRSLRLARSSRGVIAAFWPHRFAIESRTPRHWSPARRRIVGQLRHFRILASPSRAAVSHQPAQEPQPPRRATP